MKKFNNYLQKALQNGGLTIHRNGTIVNYKRGYQVSVRDCYKLRVENAERVVKAIERVMGVIKSAKKEYFCGLWVDGGYIYIDISVRILDRLDAVIIGDRLNQKSIFDWANCDCIYL